MSKAKLGYFLAAAFMLIASTAASAGMIVASFDDTNGERAEREPWPYGYSVLSYFNNLSSFTYKVEAPVGSTVRIRDNLSYGDKEELASAQSAAVREGDSFTYQGVSYTGAVVEMPQITPHPDTVLRDDTRRTTTIEIVASDGTVQESRSFDWMRDVEPVVIRDEHPYPEVAQNYQDVSNLEEGRTDLVSSHPIKVTYYGSYGTAPMYRFEVKIKSLTTGNVLDLEEPKTENIYNDRLRLTVPTEPSVMPERQGDYQIITTILDEAGNRSEHTLDFHFDGEPPEFEIAGVRSYDPDAPKPWAHIPGLEQYVEYVPGMTVKDSLPRFLVRTKKDQHSFYSNHGLMIPTDAEWSYDYGCDAESRFDLCVEENKGEDGTYVYSVTGATNGFSHYSQHDYNVFARDQAGNWAKRTASVALGDSYALRAFITAAEVKFTNGSVVEMYGMPGERDWKALVPKIPVNEFGVPTYESVETVTVTVDEPSSGLMPIKLRVPSTDGWYGTTDTTVGTLEAGSVTTTFPFDGSAEPHRFCDAWEQRCVEYKFSLTTAPSQLFELWDWSFGDHYANSYTSYNFMEGYSVQILHQQTGRIDGTLIATESRTGVVHEIDLQYSKRGASANATTLYFRTEELPLTAYDFAVRVEGQDGSTELFDIESRDFTPADAIEPKVALSANGAPLKQAVVHDAGDIVVTVTDNLADARIESAKIVGGPSDKTVTATWSKIDDTTFRITGPALAASSAANDYAITVVGIDVAGNTQVETVSFTVDSVKPAVSLYAGSATLNGASITDISDIRIRLTDNLAGADIQSAKITKPDGTMVNASWSRLDSKNFRLTGPSLSASQDAGDYTLMVEGVDAAGNTAQASASFTVDAVEPEVSLSLDGNPLEGAATAAGGVIEIRVSDNLAGASIRSATFTGGADGKTTNASWTRINSTTFRTNAPAASGSSDYTLTVVAEDAAANLGEAAATFTVDSIAPQVQLLAFNKALNGAVISTEDTIQIKLTDNRPGADLQSVTITGPDGKNDSVSWSRISADVFQLAAPDSESTGDFTISAVGIDAVGNTDQASATFTVDAKPVEVSLSVDGKPLEGAALAPSQEIVVRVLDNMPGAKIQSAKLTGPDGTTFNAAWTRINDSTYRISAPTSAGSGEYELMVVGIDAVGTTASTSARFVVDSHAPDVMFRADSDALNAASIGKPSDIRIIVSDNFSGTDLQNVTITGGPNGEVVEATVSRINDTTFRVDGPMLYASGTDGDYTITATGVDAVGNTTEASASFSYSPLAGAVAENANGGLLSIPAARHAFGEIESEPFVLSDGSTLSGSHAVTATLRSISTVSVEVNGVALAPGQTKRVASAFDFTQSNGRLAMPVAARSTTAQGSAKLLFNVEARGVGQLSASVEVWRANVVLTADKWQVKQGFEAVTIDAVVDDATRCRLTRDEQTASAQDALLDPICYLEWNVLPPGLEPASEAESGTGAIGVRGYAEQTGEQDLEYSLWIYDRAGDPFLMQQRRFKLEVVAPYDMGDFALAPREELGQVYRQIETLNITLEQSEGEQCLVTLNEDEAIRRTQMGRLSCLVEYTNVPEGLAQVEWADTPNITGVLDNGGENILSWDLFVFTPQGAKIKVNEQSLSIQASDPPLPELSMDDKERITEGLYAAPMGGGYLGDAKATSYSADLRMSLSRDGEVYESVTVPGGWGDQNQVQRRVNADVRDLWSQTPYSAKAQYAELPTYKAEVAFNVLAVPSEQITPEVTVESDEVLNTKPLSVSVRMNDPYADGGYDRETMGRWKVRLVKMEGLDTEAMTNYVTVPASGETVFTVDLANVESERLRLSAQAELISPVSAYERTVLSQRPIYLTVLRGKPIGATVEGRRLSGLAPLTGVMSLDLNNRLDYSALGDVEWEISTDKTNWNTLPADALYATRLVHVFERGTYWVRANVTNANSGAKLRTPMVRVTAYLVPKIDVEGPENAFIGSTGHYTAAARSPDGALVYEWSLDGGDSWQSGTDSFEVTRSEETRVPIWVRGRYETAPPEDAEAWDTARTRLSFREPRGPRVRISGKSLIETGRPVDYEAMVRAPYRNMDIDIGGKWTLPDGTEIDGPEMTYTATRDDLLAERITVRYEAWIADYEDQGATDSAEKTLRIWQYQWPEFRIHSRTSADYVPAEIVARLRSMTSTRIRELEDPVIEWDVPSGLTVTEEGTDAVRVLTVAEPGEYTLRAYIEDARGHSATVEETLIFELPPEYAFDLSYSASNRYSRAPMEVRVRPNVSGGHPRDRIQRYIYKLNDETVDAAGRYGSMDIREPGSHEVNVTIETQMGKTATGVLKIEANENVEPTCEIGSIGGGSYWRLRANCEDPDGRMASYEWYINGERVGLSGYRITVRNDGNGPPRVRMIGIDDGGARAPEALWSGG